MTTKTKNYNQYVLSGFTVMLCYFLKIVSKFTSYKIPWTKDHGSSMYTLKIENNNEAFGHNLKSSHALIAGILPLHVIV